MKSLLYFLMVSASSLTLCQSTKLDVNFLFKNSKGLTNNKKVEVHSTLSTDANGFARLACGENQDFILNFVVQENNAEQVKIETEIFDGELLISKPIMFINYNQRGVLETDAKDAENPEFSELRLSIVPSKEELKN